MRQEDRSREEKNKRGRGDGMSASEREMCRECRADMFRPSYY